MVACARKAAKSISPSRDWQEHSCLGADKRYSCLEVEPAEDARPEVQASTIEGRVPPLDDESQCGKIEIFTAKEQSNARTTKDTKEPLDLPSCTFVSLVVHAFRRLQGIQLRAARNS